MVKFLDSHNGQRNIDALWPFRNNDETSGAVRCNVNLYIFDKGTEGNATKLLHLSIATMILFFCGWFVQIYFLWHHWSWHNLHCLCSALEDIGVR